MIGPSDRGLSAISTSAACLPASLAAQVRRWLSSLRGFATRVTAGWHRDNAYLRALGALAAIEAERISELSEERRALRRAARRRFRLHP